MVLGVEVQVEESLQCCYLLSISWLSPMQIVPLEFRVHQVVCFLSYCRCDQTLSSCCYQVTDYQDQSHYDHVLLKYFG
jgi:hypothetical protein